MRYIQRDPTPHRKYASGMRSIAFYRSITGECFIIKSKGHIINSQYISIILICQVKKFLFQRNFTKNSYRFFLRLPFVFSRDTGAYWTCRMSYAYVFLFVVPRHISRLPRIIANLCRWLGESSPTTLYCRLVNHYTIEQSLIEVKRLWFYQ